MSTFVEIDLAWNNLIDRINNILRKERKRYYTLSKVGHETRLIIFMDRKTQDILIKVSIDFQFKTLLEKETKMLDIHSQDVSILELVKQTDSYKKLEECLATSRELERSNTVYSRLSS